DTVAVLDTVVAAATYRAAVAAEAEAQARVDDLAFGSDREKIRAARAEVAMATSNLSQAERDWARNDSLRTRGLIDERTFEQTTLTRDNAKSALEAARGRLADLERGARTFQLEGAKAALERASADRSARQRDLARLILTATRDGIVELLPYQVGEFAPAGRAIATINSPDDLWARVYVPEARLQDVTLGEQVRFRVDAAPDRDYTGTVALIASEAEFTPRNVQTPDERINLVFAVKVIVSAGQQGLRPGMPADFYFE
ncbi:MAG: HlyD family efflux transporter periplasmic adaptor subunit, partial [Planctomycetia bacterium]|nr:HlyD family efflux transporter periplasmic adaptor subunit [Planctomycetia bacterium]